MSNLLREILELPELSFSTVLNSNEATDKEYQLAEYQAGWFLELSNINHYEPDANKKFQLKGVVSEAEFLKALNQKIKKKEISARHFNPKLIAAMGAYVRVNEKMANLYNDILEQSGQVFTKQFGQDEILPTFIECLRADARQLSNEEKERLAELLQSKGGVEISMISALNFCSAITVLTQNPEATEVDKQDKNYQNYLKVAERIESKNSKTRHVQQPRVELPRVESIDSVKPSEQQPQVELPRVESINLAKPLEQQPQVESNDLVKLLEKQCQDCQSGYEKKLSSMMSHKYKKQYLQEPNKAVMETWLASLNPNNINTLTPAEKDSIKTLEYLAGKSKALKQTTEQYRTICGMQSELKNTTVPFNERIDKFYQTFNDHAKQLKGSLPKRFVQSIVAMYQKSFGKMYNYVTQKDTNPLLKWGNPGTSFVKATMSLFARHKESKNDLENAKIQLLKVEKPKEEANDIPLRRVKAS